jgi:predicted RNA binding protein YcfA (HicA-like mRNA interferase family)
VGFSDFCRLVEAFGYRLLRIRRSHHTFEHPRVPRVLILQPRRGRAKAYQVREFLELYNLTMEDER